jgi:competence protein ComEA
MFQEMSRTICSLLAVGILLAAHVQAQSAQQGSAASPGGKPLVVVNLNTAGVPELAALPGIGEKTAARIVEYRQKNGPFKKIEELMNVQGIGEKSFLKLKPQLTVTVKADSSAASRQ